MDGAVLLGPPRIEMDMKIEDREDISAKAQRGRWRRGVITTFMHDPLD
jgi:hypothetical protein